MASSSERKNPHDSTNKKASIKKEEEELSLLKEELTLLNLEKVIQQLKSFLTEGFVLEDTKRVSNDDDLAKQVELLISKLRLLKQNFLLTTLLDYLDDDEKAELKEAQRKLVDELKHDLSNCSESPVYSSDSLFRAVLYSAEIAVSLVIFGIRNTEDFKTLRPIPEEKAIYTEGGFRFNIDSLVEWIKIKEDYQNPYNRAEFSLKDQELIQSQTSHLVHLDQRAKIKQRFFTQQLNPRDPYYHTIIADAAFVKNKKRKEDFRRQPTSLEDYLVQQHRMHRLAQEIKNEEIGRPQQELSFSERSRLLSENMRRETPKQEENLPVGQKENLLRLREDNSFVQERESTALFLIREQHAAPEFAMDQVIGLNGSQLTLLKTCYINGMRKKHILDWHPPDESKTWEPSHSDTAIYLINTHHLTPSETIQQIDRLDSDQAKQLKSRYANELFVKKELRREPLQGEEKDPLHDENNKSKAKSRGPSSRR